MPTDRLAGPAVVTPDDRSSAAQAIERAVLDVLAGTPVATAAARIALHAVDLADAVQLYQAAGRAALTAQIDSDRWYQVYVECPDWDATENIMATHLGPQLRQAEASGIVPLWWYIRKTPSWRLRFHTATTLTDTKKFVHRALDDLAARDLIVRWQPSIYEPETAVFGGAAGMDTAHHLFHADSTGILDYLNRHDPTTPPDHLIGRRELSFLLCSALLCAAGQEWHEQGDVWHRVTHMRPLPPGVPLDRLRRMTTSVRRLIALDTHPSTELLRSKGPLVFARPWFASFTEAGHALDRAARAGTLERGIRDILAHHVIFHWNRLGLAEATQSILAQAAVDAIINPPDNSPDNSPGTRHKATSDVAGT